ncbi:MAG: glycosyltransferase family 39 protein [Acidobacteriota bacterium]
MNFKKENLINHIPLFVSLFVFFITTFNFNQGVEFVDEGVLNMGAWRISEGQVPYRDFFIPYTPLSFYFLAFFYKIFGVSVITGRLTAIFLSAIFIFSIYLLSKKTINNPLFASIPIIFLTQAGMVSWHFASHHWLGNIFTIFSIYLALIFFETSAIKSLFFSAFAAGLTFITITDQGFYNIVFLLILFFFFSPSNLKIKNLMIYLSGVLSSVLPLFLYLIIKVPLSTLFYDLVVFPLTGYKSIEGNKMGIFYPFKELLFVWKSGNFQYAPLWTAIASISSLLISLLPYLSVLSFIYLITKDKKAKLNYFLLFSGAMMMILTAARRWAPINLIWASSIPSILISIALAKMFKSEKVIWKRISFFCFIFLMSIFVIFGILRTASLFDKTRNIEIKSKAGTIYLNNPYLASQFIGLLNAIEQLIPEKEQFLSKEISIVNFMTLRRNPTKIDFFKPPFYSPQKHIDSVIKDLEDKNIRYIVSLNKELNEENPFDTYLSKKFTPIWQNKEFIIYKRAAS